MAAELESPYKEVESRSFATFFKTTQLVNTPNECAASQPYFINLRPPQVCFASLLIFKCLLLEFTGMPSILC